VVAETDLSGERIAAAVVAALARGRPGGVSIATDGAEATARLLAAALAKSAAA
jgi:hypothetical protein